MFQPILSVAQVLQLIGLAQAFGGAAFLSARGGLYPRGFVPVLYFLALSSHFGSMFLGGTYLGAPQGHVDVATLAVSALLPAMTCLLVVRVVLDAPPRSTHYLVLLAAVPEWLLLPLAVPMGGRCGGGTACFDWWSAFEVTRILASAAVLLVVQLWLGRRLTEKLAGDRFGREKYWLITALTATLTLTIASDLLHVMEVLDGRRALLVATVNALLFVYLVMTLLFRLLPSATHLPLAQPANDAAPAEAGDGDDEPDGEPEKLNEAELLVVQRVRQLMEIDKVYQFADFGRDSLARELGLPEHRVARLVRLGFGSSVGQLIRDFRIAEAKRQLAASDLPIGQLAFDAGFNSLPSFNRIFKAATGLSPSEFRALGPAGEAAESRAKPAELPERN